MTIALILSNASTGNDAEHEGINSMAKTNNDKTTAPSAATTETKAQKFTRLGTIRMNAALVAFDKMESLASSSAYEHTPEQAAKMVEVLRARVDNLEKLFKGEGDVGGGFSF